MGTACHENNNASLGFSRADKSVPDTTRGVVLYGGDTPISGQPDSRGGDHPYKEKKTLPGTLADVSEFVRVTALDDTQLTQPHKAIADSQMPPISVGRVGNINPIPFRSEGLPAHATHTRTHSTQYTVGKAARHPTTLYRVTGSLRTA